MNDEVLTFEELHPTPEARVRAAISLISPDIRGALLLCMDPETTYGHTTLAERVHALANDRWPIDDRSTENLIVSHQGADSLEANGFVAVESGMKGRRVVRQYRVTETGARLGRFWAGLALNATANLDIPLRSMISIYGFPKMKVEYPKAILVHDLIDVLTETPGERFSVTDIADVLNASAEQLMDSLPKLGFGGIISYTPPPDEVDQVQLAEYRRTEKRMDEFNELSYGDIRIRIGGAKFKYPGNLRVVVDYIRRNEETSFEPASLAEKIGQPETVTRRTLGKLREAGFLRSSIVGTGYYARVEANQATHFLYDKLVYPINVTAKEMTVEAAGDLVDDIAIITAQADFVKALKKSLDSYVAENNWRSVEGRQELLERLEELPRENGPLNACEVACFLSIDREAPIGRRTAGKIADIGVQMGVLMKIEGRYIRL